jgi:hypothetical protein
MDVSKLLEEFFHTKNRYRNELEWKIMEFSEDVHWDFMSAFGMIWNAIEFAKEVRQLEDKVGFEEWLIAWYRGCDDIGMTVVNILGSDDIIIIEAFNSFCDYKQNGTNYEITDDYLELCSNSDFHSELEEEELMLLERVEDVTFDIHAAILDCIGLLHNSAHAEAQQDLELTAEIALDTFADSSENRAMCLLMM